MLTQGLVRRKYNNMLIASLLGWIVCLVGELADSILAGQFISEAAVAATGLVSPIFNFNFFFSVMIGLGSANIYAIRSGRFEKDEACKTAGQAIILSLIAGAFFITLMYIGEEAVFNFYNAGPEVEAYAREYYEGMAILSFVSPPFWTIYYLVSVDGNASLVLAADLIQAFGNFGTSLILVNKIGVKGLALGSVTATLLALVTLVPHFFSKKNSIKFKLSLSFDRIKKVALLGSTAALTSVYIGIVDVVFNKFILIRFGDALLASYAIINLMLNLTQVSGCASDAASGFIATAYAEGNTVSMKKLLKTISKVIILINGSLMILFFAFAKFAPNVYGIVDPMAYDAAIYATRVIALSYIPAAFIFMYLGYFPRIEMPTLGNISGLLYSLITPIVIAMPLGLISYNAMSWGFFLTPIVSFLIVGVIVIKKFGKENFPFPIPKSDATDIFIHEFALKIEEIVLVRDTIIEDLKKTDVSDIIITKIAMIIEETFMIIKDENEKQNSKRKVLCDCTVMVYKDKVKLITRDNGLIFDITKVDEKLSSLEAYVAASLMDDSSENNNVTSVSFNRNMFLWECHIK